MSKLTAAQAKEWADTTAQVYCSFDTIDGLQIDLEPMTGAYLPNLLVFLERLGQNLASAERHCVDDKQHATWQQSAGRGCQLPLRGIGVRSSGSHA